jgi:hypothetical protein
MWWWRAAGVWWGLVGLGGRGVEGCVSRSRSVWRAALGESGCVCVCVYVESATFGGSTHHTQAQYTQRRRAPHVVLTLQCASFPNPPPGSRQMLPVSSAPLLGLSPPLPLEVVRWTLLFLAPDGLMNVAETSRGGKWLVDDKGSVELWRVRAACGVDSRSGWVEGRCPLCSLTRHHRLDNPPHLTHFYRKRTRTHTQQAWMERCLPPQPAVPGAPQPLLALLCKNRAAAGGVVLPDPTTSLPTRPLFAEFYRLRACAVRCVKCSVCVYVHGLDSSINERTGLLPFLLLLLLCSSSPYRLSSC